MLLTGVALAARVAVGVIDCVAQFDFSQGKTIRVIVGFSPGGGYDAMARDMAGSPGGRHGRRRAPKGFAELR